MKSQASHPPSIEEWYSEKKRGDRAKNEQLVAFLAVKPQVCDYMQKGYSMKTIHEYLVTVGKIHCHYDTFRIYVKNHIKMEIKQHEQAEKKTHKNSPERKFSLDSIPPKEKLI
ncbi:TraK family protein [Shewanella algae]|jgi:hypothetical protein|uniref:TraK family protein n=1 Tax=Shewanella algae TaxID=38313 RepID=UPI0011838CE4|nr:TraK family protein [Shewanella algae]MBO2558931.1 hypothetical protein [Shewanella algae]MBO2575916.1 hypothetical protein [Shewanella algae]TVO83407.1 hypothetical protein AYI80_19520 [Shewanella algae]TXS82006.1 hypothetical protein AYI81_21140 [Shewanella algae]